MSFIDKLNNPFRTIIQFAQMKVAKGGTVMEALQELKGLSENAEHKNENAERRISMVIDYVNKTFPDFAIESDNHIAQANILLKLELNLKE